jgi:DNA repair protein RecO (recombination protein O)
MSRNINTEGIVIRKIDLNEADRIVTVLTREFGKIDCIAKGARRIKSKFCGRLELFCRIRLTGFQGRDLVTLDEAQLLETFPQENELDQHRALFAIAESTHKLIQSHQLIEGAYPLLHETLHEIRKTDKYDAILYAYLIRLLTLTGFLPHWNQCALCGTKLSSQLPIFVRFGDAHAVCGSCKHPADRPLRLAVTKWIHFMQNYPLADTLRVKADAETHSDVWLWLKEVLQNVLPYPLKSEEFLTTV